MDVEVQWEQLPLLFLEPNETCKFTLGFFIVSFISKVFECSENFTTCKAKQVLFHTHMKSALIEQGQ
jgi:hypothetical protein